LYFIKNLSTTYSNIDGGIKETIYFDVLSSGKCFTSPSHLGERSYSFKGISIFDIKDGMDIPEYPQVLDFLMDK